MSVHKFIKKPPVPTNPPVAVLWYPRSNVAHPSERISNYKWRIYSQENISIQPHTTKTIELQFGVEMTIGVIFISLNQAYKKH